jgi:hypothetical protein
MMKLLLLFCNFLGNFYGEMICVNILSTFFSVSSYKLTIEKCYSTIKIQFFSHKSHKWQEVTGPQASSVVALALLTDGAWGMWPLAT